MKTTLVKCMFVILTAAMTFNFAACKDDDDTKDNGGDPTEQEGDAPDTFWDVLAQMVQADQITSDYEGKTFEPAIGVEDPTDPQTRIVYTNDMAAAATSFSYLTGVSVDENTATAEWKDEKVGTMTYTKVNDGKDYATVEVRIAAMPHLSKIIYRDGEQSGANGKFSGSAYYRFGDVVSREHDGVKEYWICVRPAFGPEKKETTHWVSVSPLSDANLYTYPGSNGFDYTLPKDLKYDKEHFQNLAEMLFAMSNPTEWQDNITNYSPKMFHDFSSKNLKYHNAAFWKNVAAAWQSNGLDNTMFGKTIQQFATDLKSDGLYLLYYKYSWSTLISNYCSLYQLHYTNTPNGKYCNMQTSSPASTIKKQMIDKKNHANDIKLSVKEQQKAHPYITCSEFFGDDKPRWIIRYATGEELSDVKKYTNVYEPISGVKEEYRYYRDVNPITTLSVHEPEITDEKDLAPAVGKILASNGKFYNTIDEANKVSEGVAIVVYYGKEGSVETGTKYRGLALALNQATDDEIKWMSGSDYAIFTEAVAKDKKSTLNTHLNGLSMTQKLNNDVIGHPAAKACLDFQPKLNKNFSEWFIPSAGQWILLVESVLGVKWKSDGTFDAVAAEDKLDDFYSNAGIYNNKFPPVDWLWSSTEMDETHVWTIIFSYDDVEVDSSNDKTQYKPVFPMIAF